MSIFVISDLHLSTLDTTNKSMEVFGSRWDSYMQRIKANWQRLVTESDTVVIPGDVSWALSLDEAISDMKFIDALPGRKLLLKGNHDFWWTTMSKHGKIFGENGIKSIGFLYNSATLCENFILAGTRGWYQDEDIKGAHEFADYKKIVNREVLRLKLSLEEAKKIKETEEGKNKEILVFLHFPPVWNGKRCEEIIAVLNEYGIKRVYFGHIHGNYTAPPCFCDGGIEYNLVAADYLGFVPKIIR